MGKSGGVARSSSKSRKAMTSVRERASNSSGVRGTGSYLIRYTKRPHEDIQRGWTAANIQRYEAPPPGEKHGWAGAGGGKAHSYERAVLDEIEARAGKAGLFYLEERWREEIAQREAEAEYRGRSFHAPASMEQDDAFIGRVADEMDIDARPVPSGEWVIYDHPGLAGFKVATGPRGAGAEPKDDNEAARMAHALRSAAWRGYQASESGDSTVGRVRYIRDLGHNLHLFWAEKVVPEDQVRTNPE